MLDLHIDRLSLTIANGAGHEHRVEPIAARAVALLGERLDSWLADRRAAPGPGAIEGLRAAPVSMDLGRLSDEAAADQLADALLAALAPRLELMR
jgi:hypothetical protein